MKLDIIKTEDIYLKSFKYISTKSKSNTLPYHNIDHLLMVFNNAYSASKYYRLDEVLRPTATKELCVAALFHDTNYGSKRDSENISNACKLFEDFFEEYNKKKIFENSKEFIDNVIDIIMATEFPYKDMEMTIQKKIIRDCDMMVLNQDNCIYNTVFALGEEFGNGVKKQINNQISFILNLKMNTEWGSKKLEKSYGGRKRIYGKTNS